MRKWVNGRGLLAATALAVLVTGFAVPAWARTNHAVLVAVTAYPNLPKRLSLLGPNHDAALVREYLLNNAPVPFEQANVSMLATGLKDATAEPTRDNILSALAAVAAKAKPDDFVYLHFSGHGAQQPTLTPETEIDGKDEIFLPSDSMPWDKKTKRIANALLDDEIGDALDKIRATGAFVWVVFDACHSGSVTRAVLIDDEIQSVDRQVKPEDLGIPAEDMVDPPSQSRDLGEANGASGLKLFQKPAEDAASAKPTTDGAKKGGMVAFFAARTVETTPEMPLPKGAEKAERLGLFTYTLFSKLAQNPSMTYRQLGHSVLQQYAADGRPSPTPIFEGELDALDAPAFGVKGGDGIMQWRVAIADGAMTIPAGRLHRLADGTRLALLPEPGSKLSDAIGYVKVTDAQNLTSSLVPVEAEGKPELKLTEIPPTAYARLGEVTLDFTMKVARPGPEDGLDKEVALVNATLDAIAAEKEEKHINIELVDAGAEADLRLAVLRESEIEGAAQGASSEPALWFLPPSGEIALVEGRRPPLIAIDVEKPEKLTEATGANLQKIFRATSLAKLASAPGGVPDTVEVKFQIKRTGKGSLEALEEATVPRVVPKDQVHIEAKNNSKKPVDINILYLGSDYSITQIGQGRRLEAGDTLKKGLLAFTADSFGMERMIAVVTQAPPQSPVEDLGFLAQGKVPTATRSIGDGISSFRAALSDIGMAPATRSVMTLDEEEDQGAVMMFSIETTPAQ